MAKEFGAPLEEVLAHLAVLGEEGVAAGSQLEVPVERRLRQKLLERATRPAGTAIYTASPDDPVNAPVKNATPLAARRRPTVPRIGRSPRIANDPLGAVPNPFAIRGVSAPKPASARPRTMLETRSAPSRPSGRKWYKGEPLPAFNRLVLDEYLKWRRYDEGDYRHRPPSGYYQDEVDEAAEIVQRWAPTLLMGLSQEDVVRWLSSNLGIEPDQAVALNAAGLQPSDIDRSYPNDGRPTLAARLKKGLASVDEVIRLAQKQKGLRSPQSRETSR